MSKLNLDNLLLQLSITPKNNVFRNVALNTSEFQQKFYDFVADKIMLDNDMNIKLLVGDEQHISLLYNNTVELYKRLSGKDSPSVGHLDMVPAIKNIERLTETGELPPDILSILSQETGLAENSNNNLITLDNCNIFSGSSKLPGVKLNISSFRFYLPLQNFTTFFCSLENTENMGGLSQFASMYISYRENKNGELLNTRIIDNPLGFIYNDNNYLSALTEILDVLVSDDVLLEDVFTKSGNVLEYKDSNNDYNIQDIIKG